MLRAWFQSMEYKSIGII
ncbi:hypothetical protein Goshw_000799 [Gossypium schwendimanii]|uniref:Uncharacterized protein n=1 Tax=Gossypium schwendimanii TaxID=34291 RepID=A0A7J9MEX9_GOSSC|nr:hypothetical protein [Gossypium schwendimanii]